MVFRLFDFGAAEELVCVAEFRQVRELKRSPSRILGVLVHLLFRHIDGLPVRSDRT